MIDKVGASVSFYDTKVKLVKVRAYLQARDELKRPVRKF